MGEFFTLPTPYLTLLLHSVPLPKNTLESSQSTNPDGNKKQTVKVYKNTNCGGTPDFTYTGTGSKATTKFNFNYQVKSVLPLPGANCNMVLSPKDAFPYFVFENNTQCWAYGHVWDSFQVTCS